ncbi:hypothetical protein EBZ39_11805 [bacterium]|nr:hypothetical protein [bacterium]
MFWANRTALATLVFVGFSFTAAKTAFVGDHRVQKIAHDYRGAQAEGRRSNANSRTAPADAIMPYEAADRDQEPTNRPLVQDSGFSNRQQSTSSQPPARRTATGTSRMKRARLGAGKRALVRTKRARQGKKGTTHKPARKSRPPLRTRGRKAALRGNSRQGRHRISPAARQKRAALARKRRLARLRREQFSPKKP